LIVAVGAGEGIGELLLLQAVKMLKIKIRGKIYLVIGMPKLKVKGEK